VQTVAKVVSMLIEQTMKGYGKVKVQRNAYVSSSLHMSSLLTLVLVLSLIATMLLLTLLRYLRTLHERS
jgi:hypothetical protein